MQIKCISCGRRGVATPASANGVSLAIPPGWRGSFSGRDMAFTCGDGCYWADAKRYAPDVAERIGLRLGLISKGKGKKAAASDEYRYSGPLFDDGGYDD